MTRFVRSGGTVYRCEVEEIEMLGPSPFRKFVPGQRRYYRDDIPISQEEFEAAARGEPRADDG